MMPIELLPGARRDFDQSFDWYAERSLEAARRFCDALDTTLTRIAENPHMFTRIDPLHRECPVRRFPFRVVYRIEQERMVIVAIAHAKRRPGFWRDRG
jgi:plasmid stabilization system protein ParE